MKKRIGFVLLLSVATGVAYTQNTQTVQVPPPPAYPLPGQEEVLQSMRLANHWFMQAWPDPGKEIVTNIARPSHIWTRSVYYEGLMALYGIDPQKAYYDYAVDWGDKHQWTPRGGITDRNADDQCCGQTYIDLFKMDPRPERVAAIKACIDNMVKSDACDDWHWIDAIQMSMPVFARLGVLFHDTAYFRKMYDLYHYTKTVHGGHGLYSTTDHLWWRDKDFVPPYKEPNGQDCFWSRGNGWVLAALVRVLSILPQQDPHRAEYLRDYLDMVDALAAVQRADGFWNVSLHDSTHFGGKELTGTSLFTYGMAWGIRQGYLDSKKFLPIVMHAWDALTRDALHPDGQLGYVQGTGKEPKDGQPVGYDKYPDFNDYGLGCFLLAGSEVYLLATPKKAVLDESMVPPYQEPDPLVLPDGRRVTTLGDWEKDRRRDIYRLFEKTVYGRMPGVKIKMNTTLEAVDSNALDGMAIRKNIVLSFPVPGTDTAARLRVALYLPRHHKQRVPVFVGYSFIGNDRVETSPQWPLKDILARGYGVATAWYDDLEPDRRDGWQTGIRTSLAGALDIEPYEWGAIGAWAWGLERIADELQTEKGVNAKQLIVIGHSRLAKTALWAAASDPRFSIVISNESGEGGAALSKREYGETIAIINYKFPYWFAPNYRKYGSHLDSLPLDQHWLLSLIAPRPLYVASAEGDRNSDPRGEFLSARLADPVYKLYGEKGLGTDSMPALSQPLGDFIRYHVRPGKHDITLYDWEQYMDFADRHFGLTHPVKKKSRPQDRLTFNFNPGWKLFVGDPQGAEAASFDDAAWKTISLPHAFNEDDAFKKAIQDLTTGIAWYRKRFFIPAADSGRKLFLEFEGIRQAGEFYLNGAWIGRHENGVMAVGFDITGKLKYGAENVLAVRVDNHWDYREKSSNSPFEWNDRNFYANYGGINKNVYLHVTGKLYQTLPLFSTLGTTGVYIHADRFDIPAGTARITAETQVKNEYETAKGFRYTVIIRDPHGKGDGQIIATIDGGHHVIGPGASMTVSAVANLRNLHWWSWGYGYLYTVSTILRPDGGTSNPDTEGEDRVNTITGFRKTTFSHGMLTLNDRPIQIKGYAQRTTNEWPAIGCSVPAWMSDLSNHLIIESNGNLVRWMHVTPWKQDVASCDRVGLMESMPAGDAEKDASGRQWEQRLELMRDAIIYNRNSPSVIFYECGNKGISEDHMKAMKEIRDRYDPHGGRAIGAREMLDSKVAEYGGEMLYIDKSATRPFWEMEYSRDEGLRKYWDNYSPPYHRDGDGPLYRGEDASAYNRNQDSHAIEDVTRWYDYWHERPGTGTRVSAGGVNIIFSESNTHFRGAENFRRSGEVDALRIPKDGFYAHQVIWDGWVDTKKPRMHILGHWNYAPGVKKDMYVISNTEKVELFVNGKSLGYGERSVHFLFTFKNVEWEPGSISAVGYDAAGKKVCETEHETAGKPAALKMTLYTGPGGLKANGADLALVEIEVTDEKGRRCPTAMPMIHFDLEGPAEWRGGMAQGPDNYILSKDLPLECGVNRVLIRSATEPGDIRLQASSDGLRPASLSFSSLPFPVQDGLSMSMPDQGLQGLLDQGPTPAGSSYHVSRLPVRIIRAEAGANNDKAPLSYDDNETTAWYNDGQPSTAWIEYTLEKPVAIGEIELKMDHFRSKSYPLRIRIDGKEVFKGVTERNLGYYTCTFPAQTGSTVRIELAGDLTVKPEQDVTDKNLNDAVSPGTGTGSARLGIIEAEVYERVAK